MKKTFVPYSRALAFLSAVMLIAPAAAEPVIVITGEPIDQPSICVMNPRLCVAGNRPIYTNPPPPIPADVIPSGASVSPDLVNKDVIAKVRKMNCAQLDAEYRQKTEEINRLGRALDTLQSQTQALTDRKNQFDAQLNPLYSAERAESPILRDAISTANAACRRSRGQLSDFDAEACQSAKAAQAAEQAKYDAIESNIDATALPAAAASAALSANLTAVAYASARIEADRSIQDFILSRGVEKQCPYP